MSESVLKCQNKLLKLGLTTDFILTWNETSNQVETTLRCNQGVWALSDPCQDNSWNQTLMSDMYKQYVTSNLKLLIYSKTVKNTFYDWAFCEQILAFFMDQSKGRLLWLSDGNNQGDRRFPMMGELSEQVYDHTRLTRAQYDQTRLTRRVTTLTRWPLTLAALEYVNQYTNIDSKLLCIWIMFLEGIITRTCFEG